MPTPKPPYPAAFRQQMVELVRAGRGVTELAREFGCNASSIHHWVNATDPDKASSVTTAAAGAPLSASERRELLELRRKLKQVQMERDILANSSRAVPRPLAKKHAAPKLVQRLGVSQDCCRRAARCSSDHPQHHRVRARRAARGAAQHDAHATHPHPGSLAA